MKSYTILTPVYNDWISLELLIRNIDESISDLKIRVNIVVVDDASTLANEIDYSSINFKNIKEISQIQLTQNLGHQRAIAIGLSYIDNNIDTDAVIVMDSDGEDNPNDIIKLIHALESNPDKVVFASRSKRSENILFRTFYYLYIKLFSILTGFSISFGNFSIIPKLYLSRIVSLSELWNHYAAAVIRSKISYMTIPTIRSNRYFGKSKMNFQSLFLHGLGSISVYIDFVGLRILIFTLILILLSSIGLIIVVWIKLFTDMAIPGWATNISIGLIIVFLQSFLISLFLIFIILGSRSNLSFIPKKDYELFINQVVKLK